MAEDEIVSDKQYLTWLQSIVQGVYLATPVKMEVMQQENAMYVRSTFHNHTEDQPVVVQHMALLNFDGVNYHPLVVLERIGVQDWEKIEKEGKSADKEGS